MGCCTKQVCAIVGLVLGGIILVLGAALMVIYGALFVKILTQEMVISPGTFFYDDLWKEVNTPTYLDYYFYNVTNAEEFLASDGSVKLHVEEIGPYRYREYMAKDKIDFITTEDPEQVKFRQKTEIYFEEGMSVGKESDLITTANIVVASIIPIIEYATGEDMGIVALRQINDILEKNNASLISTRSVHDLLYGSQDDVELIDFIKSIQPKASVLDNFGLFMNTNNSKGWFEYQVYTGKDNLDQLNVITKFKGESELPYWEGELCNMINGTDGTSTPPFMEKSERVYFFVDDVCRSLYGIFEEEVEISGVKGWKITTPGEIFEAPLYNDNNKCFCRDNTSILCNHDGGISLSTCQHGAPIMISSPHYLFGDGYYLDMVEGMSPPDIDLHVAALVYEPITGVAIKADKRLQINLHLEPKSQVSIYDPVPDDLIFPILWVNENGELTSSDAELLISLLYDIEDTMKIVQIIMCIVGGILLFSSLVYLSCFCMYKSAQVCCLCGACMAEEKKEKNKGGKENLSYSTDSSSLESSEEKTKENYHKSTKI